MLVGIHLESMSNQVGYLSSNRQLNTALAWWDMWVIKSFCCSTRLRQIQHITTHNIRIMKSSNINVLVTIRGITLQYTLLVKQYGNSETTMQGLTTKKIREAVEWLLGWNTEIKLVLHGKCISSIPSLHLVFTVSTAHWIPKENNHLHIWQHGRYAFTSLARCQIKWCWSGYNLE